MTRLAPNFSGGAHKSGSRFFCKSSSFKETSPSMISGAKPRLISTPFQVASWLPISRTITPFFEPSAYEVTGKPGSRCGAPRLCAAAQRFNEVHIVTGAGFETVAGGLLMKTVETTGGTGMVGCGATGLEGCGANAFAAAGLVQFSGDEIIGPVSPMTSGGGCVAQPARKTAAKMIPANLNTRQLCGTKMRTQAFTIDDLRLTRELEQITSI